MGEKYIEIAYIILSTLYILEISTVRFQSKICDYFLLFSNF